MPLTNEQIAELLTPTRRGRRRKNLSVVLNQNPTGGGIDLIETKVIDDWDLWDGIEPLPCPSCGVLKTKAGFCRNDNCNVDKPIETYECVFCGHCSTPEKCVRSVECPTCLAQAGDICQSLRSAGAPDSFHEERWQTVNKLYGTYYKHESDSDLELLIKLGLIPDAEN